MHPFDSGDSVFRLQSNKAQVNGGFSGFPHGVFNTNFYSSNGFRDHASAIPMGSTGRNIPSTPNMSEMHTPATAYDMNFTPLLPSQLLMGSPFQPGSPSTFASPQFQNFPSFNTQNNTTQAQVQAQAQAQQQTNPLSSATQGQQILQPQLLQNMPSSTMMNASQYMQDLQTSGNPYLGFGNQIIPLANPTVAVAAGSSRTVYLGNIPPDTSAEELLSHVRSGQIESVRLLPDKNCAFVSFLDSNSAIHFHSDAILKKLSIRAQDIKIGWGKPSQVPSAVFLAVQQSGASRNVYLGSLPTEITEEEIREDLSRFGPIDIVKLVREKNIGFVHFLSIASAIKAVNQLPHEEKWQAPRRVYYGKDRCAYVSKTQQQNAAQYLGIQPGLSHVLNSADREVISNALAQQSVAAAAVATAAGGAGNLGNRTVYLGNIHPETTMEEICNVIRGGLLHHIRFIPDKHICFVTFIDPTSAASFYALSNVQGLMIHNRRLKIGWGKHSGALPQAVALAVSGGASRNVYVGNIDESWTEERLRQDFQEYGETELINTLREKSCAFVNFTNIANAIKAIEGIKGREEYLRFKVNFGKDRCGNPPRQMHQNQQEYTQQPNYQVSQDGMTSPPANGTYQQSRNPQNGTDVSPVTLGAQRPQLSMYSQGSNGPMNQAYINTVNSNPLAMYLTQLSNQSQQQQQQPQPQQYSQTIAQPAGATQQYQHRQNSFASQSSAYVDTGSSLAGLSSYVRNGNLNVPSQQQQQYAVHSSSNSFNAPSSGGYTSSGGLLAASNLGAAARAQHSRAISLPAYSQAPPTQLQQLQQQHAPLKDIKFEGLGLGSDSGSNGYGLAIQHNGALTGWAEEDIS